MTTDVRESARLALAFLKAGLIDPDAVNGELHPAQLVEKALERALPTLGELCLAYSLQREEDVFVFSVEVSGLLCLDFTGAAGLCDLHHPKLGPCLLNHLHSAASVCEPFTPAVCAHYIEMLYWDGDTTDEPLLMRAREEIAHARKVPEERVSLDDARTYADSHYLTETHVAEHLDARYRRFDDALSLAECETLCRARGLAALAGVCEQTAQLQNLAQRLPPSDTELYDYFEGEIPYGVLIGMSSGPRDLVREVFEEYEHLLVHSTGFMPLYALCVTPGDAQSVASFAASLRVLKEFYERLEAICKVLREVTCLFH